MYRSTKHSTTLKSPAELMFGRCVRDKLPSIFQPVESEEEWKDRDKEKKLRGKEYGDAKRRAQPNDIGVGDFVLAKNNLPANKLSAPYEDTLYKVIVRNGSEAVIQSTETLATFRPVRRHLNPCHLQHQLYHHQRTQLYHQQRTQHCQHHHQRCRHLNTSSFPRSELVTRLSALDSKIEKNKINKYKEKGVDVASGKTTKHTPNM